MTVTVTSVKEEYGIIYITYSDVDKIWNWVVNVNYPGQPTAAASGSSTKGAPDAQTQAVMSYSSIVAAAIAATAKKVVPTPTSAPIVPTPTSLRSSQRLLPLRPPRRTTPGSRRTTRSSTPTTSPRTTPGNGTRQAALTLARRQSTQTHLQARTTSPEALPISHTASIGRTHQTRSQRPLTRRSRSSPAAGTNGTAAAISVGRPAPLEPDVQAGALLAQTVRTVGQGGGICDEDLPQLQPAL